MEEKAKMGQVFFELYNRYDELIDAYVPEDEREKLYAEADDMFERFYAFLNE